MQTRYFPIKNGLYEVAPGLFPLGVDLGQGQEDQKVFQIDDHWSEFRKNKIAGLQERKSKYICDHSFSSAESSELSLWIARRLAQESPQDFQLFENNQQILLQCKKSQDSLSMNPFGELIQYQSASQVMNEGLVTSSLEALCLQVQEDLCWIKKENQKDWLAYAHLCSPSHWAAEDKIGLSFEQIHRPIPGIERINRTASNMVEAMINKGPFVRFVWSFVTDQRLNHHPEAPPQFDPIQWKGRCFDPQQKCPFNLRIERQVVYGFPNLNGSLFAIRVSFWSGLEIKNSAHQTQQLISALESMTLESRKYKGVDSCFDELMRWLKS
jgi:hypothetical protein